MFPILERIIPTEITLLRLLVIIIGLFILWMIVSIPVYIAAKVVTKGKSTLGEAMTATLLGPIVYIIVLVGVDFFLGEIIGSGAYIWAYILAFIAWIWVYKSTFKTRWLGALAIAVLAIIVFVALSVMLSALFSFTIGGPFFPNL